MAPSLLIDGFVLSAIAKGSHQSGKFLVGRIETEMKVT